LPVLGDMEDVRWWWWWGESTSRGHATEWLGPATPNRRQTRPAVSKGVSVHHLLRPRAGITPTPHSTSISAIAYCGPPPLKRSPAETRLLPKMCVIFDPPIFPEPSISRRLPRSPKCAFRAEFRSHMFEKGMGLPPEFLRIFTRVSARRFAPSPLLPDPGPHG
jgi:hypothetical protein